MNVHKTRAEPVPFGLRRETVDRTRVASDQVRALESQSGVALGSIARQNLVVH